MSARCARRANSSPARRANTSPGASCDGNAPSEFDEQFVAGMVAECVVDLLEPVEVEHDDEQQPTLGTILRDGSDMTFERRAVREPGEAVVASLVFDPPVEQTLPKGGRELLGDVLHPGDVTLVVSQRGTEPLGDHEHTERTGLIAHGCHQCTRCDMNRPDSDIDRVSTSHDLWTVSLDQCAPARIVGARGECPPVGAECLCERESADVEDDERGSLGPEQTRCF